MHEGHGAVPPRAWVAGKLKRRAYAAICALRYIATTAALHEYIKRHKQRQILDLVGRIAYDPAYDYKAARRRKRR